VSSFIILEAFLLLNAVFLLFLLGCEFLSSAFRLLSLKTLCEFSASSSEIPASSNVL
jgi:hypothetical protein